MKKSCLLLSMFAFAALLSACSDSGGGSNSMSTEPTPAPTRPKASFTYSFQPTAGMVFFQNTSTNADTYYWYLKATPMTWYKTTSEMSPVITFPKNGNYTVFLQVSQGPYVDSTVQTVSVTNVPYMTFTVTGAGSSQFEATSVTAGRNSTAITVVGTWGNTSLQFSLGPNPTANSNYPISMGYPVGFTFTDASGVFHADYQTAHSSGNILVTSVSSTEIRGTFSATVAYNVGSTYNYFIITNGTFYARF